MISKDTETKKEGAVPLKDFHVDSATPPEEARKIDTHPNSPPPANAPASTPGPKRSLLGTVFVWIIVLALMGGVYYWVTASKPPPKATKSGRRGGGGTVSLTTATAQKGDIGVYLDAIGTVTPVHTASIFSQVTGVVTAVNYQEGQIVKQGDPLVDIDARPYQATLAQAQGTLERDQNLLGQARMDLDRYKAAWARNAVAKQVLDDQDKVVMQNQGTVKNDQGTVQFDQLQVDYCHITAPIPGRVGLRLVDPGNLVMAGASGGSSGANPLVVITQLQPITVVFTIAEDSIDAVQKQLRKGAKLVVEVTDRTAQTKIATGELVALDNQIDTTTGTVKVRALFKNEDENLFPNQFVNVRLLVETLKGVTLVPSATIQQNGQTSYVYAIEDDTANLREVKPGVTDGGLTQVEGIEPGTVVANSSFNKIRDKDKVVIARPEAAKDGATPGGKPGEKSGDKPGGGKGKWAGKREKGENGDKTDKANPDDKKEKDKEDKGAKSDTGDKGS